MSTAQKLNVRNEKNRKEQYEEYLKLHDLENVISEMTNSVVHSLDPNPIIYMIKYLAGLLTDDERSEHNINIDPPFPKGVPIVKFPKYKSDNLLSKYLTKDNWYDYKYIKTSFNNDINKLTYLSDHSKTDKIGIAIVDKDCLNSFRGLLNPIIYDVHNISQNKQSCDILYKIGNSPIQQKINYYFSEGLKSFIKYLKFTFYRNIEGYTYNNSNKGNNKLKNEINKSITELINDGFLPKDFKQVQNLEDFITNDSDIYKEYQWMKEAGFTNRNYTLNERAIWSNDDKSLIILVNFANHFEIISTIKDCDGEKIHEGYNNIMDILKQAQLRFAFDVHPKFGYITSNISLIGGGFKVGGLLEITHIKNVENIIQNLDFSSYEIDEKNHLFRFTKYYKLNNENVLFFLNKILVNFHGIKVLCENYNNIKINYYRINDFKNKNSPVYKSYIETFNELKYEINLLGDNINQIIEYYHQTEEEENFLLVSKYCYLAFEKFIFKYLYYRDNIDLEISNYMDKPEEPRDISDIELSEYNSFIDSIHIYIFRNIKGYPLPLGKTFNYYNSKVEELIKNALETINSKVKIGEYMSLDEAKEIINENNIKIFHNENMKKYGIDTDFPKNRGLIKFTYPNLYATVNDLNNLNFIISINNPTEKDDIKGCMVNILNLIIQFSRQIKFSFVDKLGFLTSCPKYLGNGIKISVDIKNKNFSKKFMDQFCENKNMIWSYANNSQGEKIIRIENYGSYKQSETEMLCDWLYYIHYLCDKDE